MGHIDCRDEFKIIGTLNGRCLTYNPSGQKFPRDSALRITLEGNNTDCTTGWGNNHQHGYTLYYQHYSEDWFVKVKCGFSNKIISAYQT